MLLSKIVLPCLHVPAVLSCAALGWPVWAGLGCALLDYPLCTFV